MAHGITLDMRAIKRPAPQFIHKHPKPVKTPIGYVKPRGMKPYTNLDRDLTRGAKVRPEAIAAALARQEEQA